MDKGKSRVLANYIAHKSNSVKNKTTLEDTERYIGAFLKSVKRVSDIREKELVSFVNSLHSKYSIGMINKIKSYLKHFCKWKFKKDYPVRFPSLDEICRNQKAPPTYTPEDMITEKEFKKILGEEKELFWKVLLLVYWYGCFRPIEVASLKWENVYFEPKGTIIKIYSNKNKKEFYKALPPEVEHYLKEWRKYNESEWVFPSPRDNTKHIFKKSINWKLKRLGEKALGKKINPYQLRHSIATINYNRDDIKDETTAEQMGHNKSMRAVYTQLNSENRKINVRKIYAKVKALPPEEREKLEKEIEEQKEQIKGLTAMSKTHHNNIKRLTDIITRLRLEGKL